jgi:hypothetical protein
LRGTELLNVPRIHPKKDGKQRCCYCINGISAGFLLSKWQDSNVAHRSIVHPDYRNLGLAKKIKAKVLIIL